MTLKNPKDCFAELKFWAIIGTLLVLESVYIIGLFLGFTRFVQHRPLSAAGACCAIALAMLLVALNDVYFRRRRRTMADVKILLEKNLQVMASGRECFNFGVTPVIRPQVAALTPELRQAWWDGLLAGLVEAMIITIGEKATREVCEDLYTRSQDAKAEVDRALARMRGPNG